MVGACRCEFLAKMPSQRQIRNFAAVTTPGNFNLGISGPAVKTLIIWGANDAVVDVQGGHYLDQNIPDSELVVMPNTGHLPHIEKPAAFNLLIGAFADKVN